MIMRLHHRPALWTMAIAVAATAIPLSAQDVDWSGGIRPRFEARAFDDGPTPTFVSMRTRIELRAVVNPYARIFVQVQDARLWGDETGVKDGSADQLDLHQAYLDVGHRGESPLFLRAGRQEAEWAEARLVGTPTFSQIGNAYDGVLAAIRLGERGMLDLFGYQLREAEAPIHSSDRALFGAWAELPLGTAEGSAGGASEGPTGSLQLFALHDRDNLDRRATRRTTLGAYLLGDLGPLSARIEGALQRGDLQGFDLSADMLNGRVTLPVFERRGDLTIWYDRYSGDADAFATDGAPTGAFDDLFGRNHRFLGFADLFGDVPAATRGRGIQDVALRLGWGVLDGGRLGADLHRFLVTDDAGLAGGTLADELDLFLRLPTTWTGFDLLAGVSAVWAGDAGRALGAVPSDQFYGYLQLDAVF
ncbi:MAG: alginate export family protein [Gemmatimonadetes bacterium]|nr:alginate export family protein [Gemmatimonadota bacterium]